MTTAPLLSALVIPAAFRLPMLRRDALASDDDAVQSGVTRVVEKREDGDKVHSPGARLAWPARRRRSGQCNNRKPV